MIEYRISKSTDIDSVRENFNEVSWVNELTLPTDKPKNEDLISLSSIYAYIKTASAFDENLEKTIRSNINLWKFYKKIISETATLHLPQAMAASSAEIPYTRHGDQWTVTIELSRAEPEQVYIIFKLGDSINQSPKSIFFFKGDETHPRWELPEINDGVIQLISDRHSDLVKLLMDPKTEAYLW
jgi:hypothetical protein